MKKQKEKELKLYVDGMHCAACELLIEDIALSQDGVISADASMEKGVIFLQVNKGKDVSLDTMNHELSELDYSVSDQPIIRNTKVFVTDNNGNTTIHTDILWKKIKRLALLFTILLLFFWAERSGLGAYANVDSSSSLGAFFILGVVAGLSSCAALIGGILMSLTRHWQTVPDFTGSFSKRLKPHLGFHIGRLIAYALGGALLGGIGQVINIGGDTIYTVLTLAVSMVMLILGLQMLNVKWALKLKLSLPSSISHRVSKVQGKLPWLAGAATFLLPCGFTLIAQGVALLSGSIISGAMIMLAFALGTLPILVLISAGGMRAGKKRSGMESFNFIAGVLIIIFSIYSINGQFNVLGIPSLSDIFSARQEVVVNTTSSIVDGVQEVQMIASGFSYRLVNGNVFEAGVPTVLRVKNDGIQGCAAFVASRGLIDGFVALGRGITDIDLGVVPPGTYKVTCSMGMVRPITITFK
jgi:sulfite exporter TauE/SafE/copper chaperone CopZ